MRRTVFHFVLATVAFLFAASPISYGEVIHVGSDGVADFDTIPGIAAFGERSLCTPRAKADR